MKNRENFAELSQVELEEKYRHFKEELFNLRFQVVTGQLTNTARISSVKENIARVKTFLNRLEEDSIQKLLKNEYDQLIKEKGFDPMKTPLREKIFLLQGKLSGKVCLVKKEIRVQYDVKVQELLKGLRGKISEKLKECKGKKETKEEAELRASSRRLANPRFVIRKKFLDKLSAMGLNEASQIKSLKEAKRVKLDELERIQALQRELSSGRLPF